jgi:hypothetical protein
MFVNTFGVIQPFFLLCNWRTPKLFDGFNYESKGEENEMKRSWGAVPGL